MRCAVNDRVLIRFRFLRRRWLPSIVTVLAVVCGLLAWTTPARAILGGIPTADASYAAVVDIKSVGTEGSGTLISDSWVLTAAHVVDDVISGGVGQTTVIIQGTPVAIAQAIKHPNFNPSTFAHDVGLLQLAVPQAAVTPRPLFDNAVGHYNFIGQLLTILGYGLPLPGTLQVGTGTVAQVDPARLTLEGPAFTQPGDSGGPTLVESVIGTAVLGVHSLGAPGFSVEVLVGPERPFIDAATGGAASWVTTLANQVPVAVSRSLTTDQITPVAITLTATDLNKDVLTFAITSPPSHGVLSGTPPQLTYTPDRNSPGSDAFAFTASDGQLTSAPAAINIQVDFVPRFVVDRMDDEASAQGCLDAVPLDCSLRGATLAANAFQGRAEVVLPAGAYRLTTPGADEDLGNTGDLDVTGRLFLNGAGAAVTSIDGNSLDRVLHVHRSAEAAISGTTITNEHVSGDGGAILAEGSFTAVDSRIENSVAEAGRGGGVFTSGFVFTTLTRTIVSGNSAPDGFGGGVAMSSFFVTLQDSQIRDNTGDLGGGGILQLGGTVTATGSTISGNQTVSFDGNGGGVLVTAGTASFANSTISGNIASAGNGGGVFETFASVRFLHATISNNRAPLGFAGGVGNDGSVQFAIRNSIVAGNSDAGGAPDCGGALSTGGGNLIGSLSSCIVDFDTTDLFEIDPKLGPLANNGGFTPTHALLDGSPAIDHASNAACLANDQRGVKRPSGPGCDIGAFEREVPTFTALVRPPIQADGSSVFAAKRAVIPVKFTLMKGGLPTCVLPPARLMLTTQSGVPVAVVGSSDFRVSECQYVNNLSTENLGRGTYRLIVTVDNTPAGGATFILK